MAILRHPKKGGFMITIIFHYIFSMIQIMIILVPSFLLAHNITVIGTGYVGLVSGAGFAELGHRVVCADIDAEKIAQLKQGIIPIYEPGLEQLVSKNVSAGLLSFTSDTEKAIAENDILFIAVGTPMSDEGKADMKYVYAVVDTIGKNFGSDHKIIVTKSTVPVNTGKEIRSILEKKYNIPGSLFSVVSNPEFLREGSAVEDFLNPDRIVIGADNEDALCVIGNIYQPLIDKGSILITTNLQTAELIKYAANAMLALKLTFINQIANLADKVLADTKKIAYGIGSDKRIGHHFLNAGPGYGGSCFPKDTQALWYIANQYKVPLEIVKATIIANEYQKTVPVQKLKKLFKKRDISGNLRGKKVAILGLAFKGNTDDVRYSPAISIIEQLQKERAMISAYDEAAAKNMQNIFPDIEYFECPYETVKNADAIIIATEWESFKSLDFDRIATLVKNKIIIDARNIIDPEILKNAGFFVDAIGQYCCYA